MEDPMNPEPDDIPDHELTHGFPASFFCPTCGYAKHLHAVSGCPSECPACRGERYGKDGYQCRRCKGTGVINGARP
jgi:hypothetical protein